jgi:hypothetical protein
MPFSAQHIEAAVMAHPELAERYGKLGQLYDRKYVPLSASVVLHGEPWCAPARLRTSVPHQGEFA